MTLAAPMDSHNHHESPNPTGSLADPQFGHQPLYAPPNYGSYSYAEASHPYHGLGEANYQYGTGLDNAPNNLFNEATYNDPFFDRGYLTDSHLNYHAGMGSHYGHDQALLHSTHQEQAGISDQHIANIHRGMYLDPNYVDLVSQYEGKELGQSWRSGRKPNYALAGSSHQHSNHHDNPDNFIRPERLSEYNWQRDLSVEEVMKVYKAVIALWPPGKRNTNISNVDKLNVFLEKNEGMVQKILNYDKAVILDAATMSIPRSKKPLLPNQPRVLKEGEQSVEQVLNYILSDIVGMQNISRKRPRWAPDDMDFPTQDALINVLHLAWGLGKAEVRSRLKRIGKQLLGTYVDGILSKEPGVSSQAVKDLDEAFYDLGRENKSKGRIKMMKEKYTERGGGVRIPWTASTNLHESGSNQMHQEQPSASHGINSAHLFDQTSMQYHHPPQPHNQQDESIHVPDDDYIHQWNAMQSHYYPPNLDDSAYWDHSL